MRAELTRVIRHSNDRPKPIANRTADKLLINDEAIDETAVFIDAPSAASLPVTIALLFSSLSYHPTSFLKVAVHSTQLISSSNV